MQNSELNIALFEITSEQFHSRIPSKELSRETKGLYVTSRNFREHLLVELFSSSSSSSSHLQLVILSSYNFTLDVHVVCLYGLPSSFYIHIAL